MTPAVSLRLYLPQYPAGHICKACCALTTCKVLQVHAAFHNITAMVGAGVLGKPPKIPARLLTSFDEGFRVACTCQLVFAYNFEYICRSSQRHGVPGMACWSCHHDTFLGGHPLHPVSDVCTS